MCVNCQEVKTKTVVIDGVPQVVRVFAAAASCSLPERVHLTGQGTRNRHGRRPSLEWYDRYNHSQWSSK